MAFKKYSVSPLNFVENEKEVSRFEKLKSDNEDITDDLERIEDSKEGE